MNPPVVLLSTVNNMNIRMMAFASTGDFEYVSAADVDTVLLIAKGKFAIEGDEQLADEVIAPQIVKVRAGIARKLIARSDGSVVYRISN